MKCGLFCFQDAVMNNLKFQRRVQLVVVFVIGLFIHVVIFTWDISFIYLCISDPWCSLMLILLWHFQERKEREAQAAEDGWTVVVHHKGRKKTTDTESGVVVGSVAQATVVNKMSQKKDKQVGLDFYRFQKREAQRNGMTT